MQTAEKECEFVPQRVEKERKVYYLVKKGDSLWSIAKKFNTTIKALIYENKIKSPDTIAIGTKLTIPANESSKNKLLFHWPVRGKIVSCFGEKINNKVNKGIEIETREREVVRSSAGGQVTFSNYIKGYGHTVIIKHPKNLSTVYSNLTNVFVEEKTFVKEGDAIGKTGKDNRSGLHILHFEIRENYRAENPLAYLKKE